MATVTLGDYATTRYPCELDAGDDLRRAIYVLGTQGAGKSTLLGHLAEQFADAGEGVLLIDTKGELAEDVAARTRHADRLVFVAPGRCFFPEGPRYWALNPFDFDRAEPHLAEIVVYNLLSLFERMGLAKLDTMPQVVQMLEMATRLALVGEPASFTDLLAILQVTSPLRRRLLDEGRRTGRLGATVASFWEDFEERTPAQRREATRTTIARLNRLLGPEVIARLLTPARSTLRLAEWLDAGKLVVCDLGTRLGIGAQGVPRLLGNLLVAQAISLTFARPIGRGRVWRVLVDEFHELAGDQFAELITQGRKFRVFPVLAHQNLAQLGERVANAATSCPVRLLLKVSPEDAPVVGRLFGRDAAERVRTLENYQAQARLALGPEGYEVWERLQLRDWWAARDEAQLAAAIRAAADVEYTYGQTPAETPAQREHGVYHTPPGGDEDVVPVTPDDATEGALSDGCAGGAGRLLDDFDAPAVAAATPPPGPEPGDPPAPAAHRPRPRRPRTARPVSLLDQWPGE